jgi:hypothetical protein
MPPTAVFSFDHVDMLLFPNHEDFPNWKLALRHLKTKMDILNQWISSTDISLPFVVEERSFEYIEKEWMDVLDILQDINHKLQKNSFACIETLDLLANKCINIEPRRFTFDHQCSQDVIRF